MCYTSGPLTGNSFFLINGLIGTGDEWMGTASGLTVGVSYTVSGFGVSVNTLAPPSVRWFIGTTAIGASTALPGPTGSPWTQFNGTFVATAKFQSLAIRSNGGDVGIELSQTNANPPARTGNDFGLDNLTITETVPEPATYILFATGLVAIAALRRRK